MDAHVSAKGLRPGVEIESAYAWLRLAMALALGTIGCIGMWSFVVALPSVQAEFGLARGAASLPFTLTMMGFGIGGVVMGRFADRGGIARPLACGALVLGGGYALAGSAGSVWQFALAQGLIGFGSSAAFGPLMGDISHWFERRRGIAVAVAASGNYLAGTLWPPLVQHFIARDGWRTTHVAIGVLCVALMLPLVLGLRRPAPRI